MSHFTDTYTYIALRGAKVCWNQRSGVSCHLPGLH